MVQDFACVAYMGECRFTGALCPYIRLIFQPEADSLPGRECLIPLWAPEAWVSNWHVAGIPGAHTGSRRPKPQAHFEDSYQQQGREELES